MQNLTCPLKGDADTWHCVFMVCLKFDVYQPEYAQYPMQLTVTPCPPSPDAFGNYGVGTKFTGNGLMGTETNTIVEMVYPDWASDAPAGVIKLKCGQFYISFEFQVQDNVMRLTVSFLPVPLITMSGL